MPPFFGASRKVREANKGLGEAPKSCTRKEHESTTNSIAKRGQGGTSSLFVCPLQGQGTASLVGFGATPQLLVGRSTQRKKSTKGAGSEASLPVTLRVRRRAPKLLFPQDSVKNPFFGADFLAKETHLICCISWMRCVLWLDFLCGFACAPQERRGGGGDRKAPSSLPQERNPCINTRKQPESVTN